MPKRRAKIRSKPSTVDFRREHERIFGKRGVPESEDAQKWKKGVGVQLPRVKTFFQ